MQSAESVRIARNSHAGKASEASLSPQSPGSPFLHSFQTFC